MSIPELGDSITLRGLRVFAHHGVLASEREHGQEYDPVDLIETVAERVAQVVLAHDAAAGVRVTVHKPAAPIEVPFDDVEVSITRMRQSSSQPVGFGR